MGSEVTAKKNTMALVGFISSLVNFFCCGGLLFLVPVITVTCSPFSVPVVEGKPHAVLTINS